MIYLQTEGGLANRLRAIASAYKLAEEQNVTLTVGWNMDKYLNCAFGELFALNTDILNITNRRITIFDKVAHKILPSRYFDIDNEENRAQFIADFQADSNKDYYIHSFSNFYKVHDYNFLKPVSSIDMRVSELLGSTHRSNLVGVQIRRTDNAQSIANSPTEMFIEYMQQELQTNPQTVFYLATDDMKVRSEIIRLFPDKVIYNQAESVSRRTKLGMIDAMIDFISLSRCSKIYGSYWSSFCEVASDIGKNELVVVKKI
ncbi:MAG: hypothetical protein IKQ61_06455 [Spirochaetales bacterium]|nr:hypothetical protein [Spirochaetales bacterium]